MPHPSLQAYQLWGWIDKNNFPIKTFHLQITYIWNTSQHLTVNSINHEGACKFLHYNLRMLWPLSPSLVGCYHCVRMGFFCVVIWRQLGQARGDEVGIVKACYVAHNTLHFPGSHNTGQPSLPEWECCSWETLTLRLEILTTFPQICPKKKVLFSREKWKNMHKSFSIA